ncbi:glycosyltransferase family 2 protein [Iodobacter fluviatilis]|uniref:Acetylgalactosaminyl-proteoglycan 3-beta-glucuronosyltransferase n=1 Tax=Iodobacter fluviatilis TaxID=537 RepID=A0A7G3G8L6_9NEIS|nr:glycosyltransferase [Iodobacter fluviatilis]QBC43667.1 acetylgalactosaminyl-proteoglycan 3-beta-glucuronosyltransferase [Iodobacter fluviatilis]
MKNEIVSKANQLYIKGDYLNAYNLYKKAAAKLKTSSFNYNLFLCEKKLNLDVCTQEKSTTENDAITKLLQINANEIKSSAQEKSRYLAIFNDLKKKKSEPAEARKINPIPSDWPKDLTLAPLPESTNDFAWQAARNITLCPSETQLVGLSIVIPTFNRTNILDITLACLVNQKTNYRFEVIAADDGSHEELTQISRKYENLLDIKFVRQRDYGYQLCAVRNLGLRTAKYDYVAILDCDMAPGINWVESYMELLVQSSDVALIGPRKYVNTQGLVADSFLEDPNFLASLPEIVTNNNVAGKVNGVASVDWRLEHFQKTDNLRLCDSPFRFFSGGNVAFAKKWLSIAGWFDEEFTHWGGEDNEFGYRLYRAGCFFRAIDGGLAFHQEPPGKENETDRAAGKAVTIKIVEQKVPYFYRKLETIDKAVIKHTPLVSIYIPAYNCEKYIEQCVNSALNQTITDLEVCICDDGSTDATLEILKHSYGQNPRVHFLSKENGGIGAASNAAIKLCRGYYIGQLDSDDFLEPDAVELCLKEFMSDKKLACVYTTNRNLNPDGSLIANGYNWPEYSREKLTTAMICHHFRMFTMRAWNLTSGFDEKISNAVDYDMYLKLSEVGPFKHLNRICYNRVLHGENTSIKKLGLQKENHFSVVNMSLQRQNIKSINYRPLNDDNDACRKYYFTCK